jgi:hypothetical protein
MGKLSKFWQFLIGVTVIAIFVALPADIRNGRKAIDTPPAPAAHQQAPPEDQELGDLIHDLVESGRSPANHYQQGEDPRAYCRRQQQRIHVQDYTCGVQGRYYIVHGKEVDPPITAAQLDQQESVDTAITLANVAQIEEGFTP